MSCYSTVWAYSTDDPWLPSVSHAVVLTLQGSTRLTTERLESLGRLCRTTVVQVNACWRECKKPAYVRSTAHDLIHAYRNACRLSEDTAGPVLILEDDAEVFDGDRAAFRDVDEFVRRGVFDVYSLGSAGEFVATEGPHRRFGATMGFSQAVVWSAAARRRLLESPCDATHIDVHSLSQMALKYTYYRPLVVQLFPTTANMATWCMRCKDEWWERGLVCAWQAFLQRGLKLDRRPDGWKAIYTINAGIRPVKTVIAPVLGALTLACLLCLALRGHAKVRGRP